MRFSRRKRFEVSNKKQASSISLDAKGYKSCSIRTIDPPLDPMEIFPRGLTKLYRVWLRLTYPFALIGRNVSFQRSCKVSRQRATRIMFGNSVSIGEHAWLNVADDSQEAENEGEPTIVIEDNCIVNFGSIYPREIESIWKRTLMSLNRS